MIFFGLGKGLREMVRQPHPLPDDLVRPEEDGLRDREPQGLGGFEVDDELELHGLLDGEVGRLDALQDSVPAEKRCGKSRVLKLLARLAFNASPVTAFPTEAQLYRSAARTGGAQLFDEVETLKGDEDRFEALIAVLNVGFEKGGVVSRLEKRGEKFVEVHYEVYAPRVLAGLTGLKDTLEDRAIPVFMLRKRREEPVARLTQAVETKAQALRDQCALACLTRIGDILTAYEAAPAPREGGH